MSQLEQSPSGPSSPDWSLEARRVFREFLERWYLGEEGADFEALCAAQPALAPELRRLHANWRDLSGMLDGLADLLRETPITLPGEPATGTSSEVVSRLISRRESSSHYRLAEE